MAQSPPLKVLLLPVPGLYEPWCADVVTAIGAKHDLRVFERGRPIEEQFRDVDVVIDHGGHNGTHEMMEAARSARLWQIMSIGVEHVDLAYLRPRFEFVARVPGTTSAVSLAQTALMFILMLAHRVRQCDRNFHDGTWLEPAGVELEGRALGIVGVGHSGRRLGPLATALGMRVSGVNRTPRPDAGFEVGPMDDLDALIGRSDFLSVHLALTDETRGILDARRIGLLRPDACLINVARGGLVDQAALFEALRDGRIGGAGLDVFETEPADPSDPVYARPNVVVTPHIAAFTDGSSRKRAESIAENVDRLARGESPQHLV
ncbi:MAG: hypothetical protein CMJ18_09390 [Phycisphaeraceae bacterium]|nr:hypothetical protein [Phycisphaeraceae bacterium]